MQSLVTWFLTDIITWIVIGIAAWRIADGVKDSKIGQVVWSFVIGAAAYYFVQNPQKVLEYGGNIISKLFGG